MSRMTLALAAATALAVMGSAATVSLADSHTEAPRELEAREGLMIVNAIASGITGDMARGKAEYDAVAAQSAADALVGTSMVPTALLWPEGTGPDVVEGTASLAAIWENRADFDAKWADFGTAAAALQAAAGQGPEQLTAAMADVGKSCGACHTTYRLKE